MSRFIEQPGNMVVGGVAALTSVFGTINQDTLVAVAGSVVAVGAVLTPAVVRLYRSIRDEKRNADTADFVTWQKEVSPEVVKRAEFEGENNFLKRRVAELEQANKAMQDQIAALGVSQNRVIEVVKSQRDKVKRIDNSVKELEQTAGSSSNLSLPTEPSTAIDLPNIE